MIHRFFALSPYIFPCTLDILFCQITTFIKVRVAFGFGLQTLSSIDFTKTFQLKGLKPKNKGHMNFYECCDLTKKVYLIQVYTKYFLTSSNTHISQKEAQVHIAQVGKVQSSQGVSVLHNRNAIAIVSNILRQQGYFQLSQY